MKSIGGIQDVEGWKRLIPDEEFDWINQGSKSFGRHIVLGDKKTDSPSIFENYSGGIKTNRDAWCYNPSRVLVETNMSRLVDFYFSEIDRYLDVAKSADVAKFIDRNPKKISWDAAQIQGVQSARRVPYSVDALTNGVYRPFTKQWLYFDSFYNNRTYQMPKIFPDVGKSNLVISLTGLGSTKEFSVLLMDQVPDLEVISKSQCFPLKLYAPASADDGLFATGETGYSERDGISDAGQKHFQDAYAGEQISKEDLFYYIYGLLHSPDYRTRFKNNLSKELPRIPAVKTAADFWAYSKAGRALGDLHVNYETVEPYPVVIKEGDLKTAVYDDPKAFYRVEKMKFGGKGKNKDKTTVHYNPHITMTGIPLAAYDYVVNGKPALDWVMERQSVKADKKSGIVNDANDYANETVGNPAYPLELFQRVITVSLETMKIVNGLPALDID